MHIVSVQLKVGPFHIMMVFNCDRSVMNMSTITDICNIINKFEHLIVLRFFRILFAKRPLISEDMCR